MIQSCNIYVVHGYTANSKANWYPDLKNHLETENIAVHIFDMPNAHAPVEKEWLEFLEANITNFDDKSIFIGHSLGCTTILRFLEDKKMNNIESLFLISGFVEDSPIPELSEFVKGEVNYSKFIETIKNIVVVSAEDDDIVSYHYSEVLAKKLDAQFKLLKTGKHFIDRDGFTTFPYLINLIQKMNYRNKAISCVKDTILPMQKKQFEECGRCLDEQYKRYGNTEWLFAKTVEKGHVYEIGYPACVCPDVVSGKVKDASHCECSRQSVLYIIGNLLPDKNISVEIIETVLSGAEKCRFKVTVG